MRSLLPLKFAVLIALGAWLWLKPTAPTTLPDWRDGELIVIVPPAALETENAFEVELATLFAQQMQLKLVPLALPAAEAVPALMQHQAHFSARIRISTDYPLRFSRNYHSLSERALCVSPAPRNLNELAQRNIVVIPGSPQEAALRQINRAFEKLEWSTRSHTSPIDLLSEVAENKLDCTVANEDQIAAARNFYPDLGKAFDLNAPSELAWAFAPDGDDDLYNAAQEFHIRIKQDGTLRRLVDRYYGHIDRLEAVDASTFIADTRTVLPHYRAWFEEAADLTGLEWQLLAALAYRESHWDPLATSPTNVRGMMMLTEDTADQMGVPDRLDPYTSIIAGARYLQSLKEQLPLRMSEQDRLWMALAAYNQGMGHLEDARILTAQAGLNPDVWADVKRMMPLLSRPAVYAKTKRGKARGGEAVILVETVRLYYDMLKRLETEDTLYQLPSFPHRHRIGGFYK